jgi:hypothetical protein
MMPKFLKRSETPVQKKDIRGSFRRAYRPVEKGDSGGNKLMRQAYSSERVNDVYCQNKKKEASQYEWLDKVQINNILRTESYSSQMMKTDHI